MRDYYNHQSGCFAGWCLIKMGDGSLRKVQDLKKDDFVMTPKGPARIKCIVQTKSIDGFHNLCVLPSGLVITEWHPIVHEGKWTFPIKVTGSKITCCPAVFSLVLDKGHVVNINDTSVICLGHDLDDPVLQHEYFGSDKVINDLAQMPGWNEGKIHLKAGCIKIGKDKRV